MENCQSCKFWLQVVNEAPRCRRFPVTTFKGPDEWCGEYRDIQSMQFLEVPTHRPEPEPEILSMTEIMSPPEPEAEDEPAPWEEPFKKGKKRGRR